MLRPDKSGRDATQTIAIHIDQAQHGKLGSQRPDIRTLVAGAGLEPTKYTALKAAALPN